ncbi:AfsR/SARP family transcriptional regulator [Actinomadura sp. 9N407]|uniref:AfsR/SARP family transcriptional regulator n=1 Tax=Actinomadura sp. 9N407 TaxID=3375154 RepID=UPI0037917B83
MRFGVLGPVSVWTDDGRPVPVPEAKVRALLAGLLVTPGRPVPSDRLIDDLWGDHPPRNPSGTLQARVSQLRKALGDRDLVVFRPPGYALQAPAGAVDAERFETLIVRAGEAGEAGDPRVKAGLLADALALWRGPAFADFGDAEFARAAIAGLEERRLAALEELAATRLRLGEHARVAGELAELVERHPSRERLRAAYMHALYLAGRQSEALATYQDLRENLAEELGLDPGPEVMALHQAILTQDPALAVTVPVAGRPRTNVPGSRSELIGRERAAAEARALLKTDRLVTLTGPGGVGKTRLALEVAAVATRPDASYPDASYPDGVWLVELAPGNPADVAALADTVAGVLGVRDEPGPASPVERLASVLKARRTLLVLDNCEHVIATAAELAARLLAAAPELRILATSREPLGIEGERLQVVPPLDLPGPGAEEPERFSAVRLFVARAAAAAPGFALDERTAGPVATICRRLDGIPLALELAATRVRALGVTELAARLDDRFRVLAAGRRDAPARQRTLRAVIDWSWELLEEPERLLLRRLAVHADGCALEAAERVCGEPELDVVGLLAGLVDRSLVTVTHDGEARYRLLESVAAYGLERLREAGEEQEIRHRHARHYAGLAERVAPLLRGTGQRDAIERLDREGANLSAALEWAAGNGFADLALRLVNALAWHWYLRGRYGEARRSLALALDVPGPAAPGRRAEALTWRNGMTMMSGDGGDSERLRLEALAAYQDVSNIDVGNEDVGNEHDVLARARAEWFLAYVHWPYGDLAANEVRADRALAAFQEHGDRWGTAAALSTRAKQAMVRGDLDGLRRDGERALVLFDELGDRWGRLEATEALGRHAEITGDYGRAATLRREGLRLAEELEMGPEAAFRMAELGRVALLTGDLVQARELHERALRMGTELASRDVTEFAEVGLALVARRLGEHETAERHLRACLGGLRRIGGRSGISFILAQLGFVAAERGDAAGALALHREALDAARSTGDPRAVALAVEGIAGARALAGHHAHAARLLGTAAALRAAAGAPLPPAERGDVDRIASSARAALGEEDFARAFARGSFTRGSFTRGSFTRRSPA